MLLVHVADDGTTSTYAVFNSDASAASSWYLIVSTAGEVRSRVVPLLDGGSVVFGRVASCTVPIDHEAVSRKHAEFRRRGDEVIVEDQGSRNGTLVNGTPIKGPRRLTAGDAVAV